MHKKWIAQLYYSLLAEECTHSSSWTTAFEKRKPKEYADEAKDKLKCAQTNDTQEYFEALRISF